MLRYLQFVMLWPACVLAGGALFVSGSALADGVAVFASLTDADSAQQTKTRLVADLDVPVETSQLEINGTQWIRLHSATMPTSAARDLVSRAQRSGYSAWFNGSGGSLVTSSSAAAARVAAQPAATGALVDQANWSPRRVPAAVRYGSPQSRENWGVVTPASGDISHLPMAETFPLDGPGFN